MADVTDENVLAFLKHLEDERGNAAKTVNCRLAAFKSFCGYASYRRPDPLGQLKAVRELPQRKERSCEAGYLTPEEVGWVIAACPAGSESELLLSLLYNTGARVSEILGARARDVTSGDGGSGPRSGASLTRPARTCSNSFEACNTRKPYVPTRRHRRARTRRFGT